MIILVIPRYHIKRLDAASAVKSAATMIQHLAALGHILYVVVPSKTTDKFSYDFNALFSKGHANIVPVEIRGMLSDTKMGVVPSMDLCRLLTPRTAALPYDAILNFITPLTVPAYRYTLDVGYTRLTPPIITVLGIAALYDYFDRLPAGIRAWYQMWEYLEIGAACFGKVLSSNPTDTYLLRKTIGRRLAPALAKTACKNIISLWQPLSPIADCGERMTRTGNQNKLWKILIVGGFGQAREELGQQAEMTLNAIDHLTRFDNLPLKLYVCTQTAKTQWHTDVCAKFGDRIEIDFNAGRERLAERLRECHFAINCREYDGLNLAFLEQAWAGIPIIWLAGKYSIPWVIEPDRNEFTLEDFVTIRRYEVAQLIGAIRQMTKHYERYCKSAARFAERVKVRHSPDIWRATMQKVLTEEVAAAQAPFIRGRFPALESAFALPDSLTDAAFDTVLTHVKGNMKSGGLSLYSRHWVLCMLRKRGWKEYIKDEQLRVKRG